MWAEILGDHIIGPLFIEEIVTSIPYLEMLESVVQFDKEFILQQNEAPSHFAVEVKTFFNIVHEG